VDTRLLVIDPHLRGGAELARAVGRLDELRPLPVAPPYNSKQMPPWLKPPKWAGR
jgi:hypothetical protein